MGNYNRLAQKGVLFARQNEDPGGSVRLALHELELLGIFLYGRRWKSPLARALGVSARHMRRLARGDRPVSVRLSGAIITMARLRHASRERMLGWSWEGLSMTLSESVARRLREERL